MLRSRHGLIFASLLVSGAVVVVACSGDDPVVANIPPGTSVDASNGGTSGNGTSGSGTSGNGTSSGDPTAEAGPKGFCEEKIAGATSGALVLCTAFEETSPTWQVQYGDNPGTFEPASTAESTSPTHALLSASPAGSSGGYGKMLGWAPSSNGSIVKRVVVHAQVRPDFTFASVTTSEDFVELLSVSFRSKSRVALAWTRYHDNAPEASSGAITAGTTSGYVLVGYDPTGKRQSVVKVSPELAQKQWTSLTLAVTPLDTMPYVLTVNGTDFGNQYAKVEASTEVTVLVGSHFDPAQRVTAETTHYFDDVWAEIYR